MTGYDAVIVGSGPNGLAAAVELARAGRRVAVLEAEPTIGGGMRSAELTLPGFIHDVCSAVHPLLLGSPFLRRLPLQAFGVEPVHAPLPLAHPLDDGSAAVLDPSVARTATGLARDGAAYRRLLAPLVRDWAALADTFLGPYALPRRPISVLRFGLPALVPAAPLARAIFRQPPARALFAGLAAHSMLSLETPGSAAFALVLGMLGHAVGWPVVRGGSARIAEALAAYLGSLGGQVHTSSPVRTLAELPEHGVALLDMTPRQVLRVAAESLPDAYCRSLHKFRYGPGVFKVDWALDAPIPWTADACRHAATVHVGGTLEEIAAAERGVWRGEHPARPFVLLTQPSLFDPTRAPAGRHTAWAYCHVPNGSRIDMAEAIEQQIERFAPGFRARIAARATKTTPELERYNPNYVGGDINGGAQDLLQMWTRPVARLVPYATPNPGLFLCSSSTPPGGGVHGMCGFRAARVVLGRTRKAGR